MLAKILYICKIKKLSNMHNKKKLKPQIKSKLHIRNKHRNRYDLVALAKTHPVLKDFLITTEFDELSIDFFNPQAVKALNAALLMHHYNIKYWDIPPYYLIPPIPGRADYIHYIADLLAESNEGKVPTGEKVIIFDIGVGSSCVYPIIGISEYDWSFICSDIDSTAIESTKMIAEKNETIKNKITIKLQEDKYKVFSGIIEKDSYVDAIICNPPFHSSQQEAKDANLRKLTNLKKKRANNEERNFGGISAELWCIGGEAKFVKNMIHESVKYGYSCFWFTSLISKEENIFALKKELERVKAKEVRVIPMGQGNKTSRILAWTFQTEQEKKDWKTNNWV